MRNLTLHFLVILGALLGAALPGFSQPSQPTSLNVWRIEVESNSPINTHGYTADLYDLHRQRLATADLSTTNILEFRNVAYGEYSLVVKDDGGTPVFQGFVSANSNYTDTSIRLEERARVPPPSGPVSVTQLRHPPSSKAIRSTLAAQKLAEAGGYQKAAEELEKVVRISPEYPLAHSLLATQYARLQRYEDAAAEAQRAVELGTPNHIDLCNLAYAQAALHRKDQALDSVRRCLALAPEAPQGHYILGSLLAQDLHTLPEAIPHLERAAAAMPNVRPRLEAARQALIRFAPADGQ